MDNHDHAAHNHPQETPREYFKFALVIAGIVIGSVLLTYWRGWELRQIFRALVWGL